MTADRPTGPLGDEPVGEATRSASPRSPAPGGLDSGWSSALRRGSLVLVATPIGNLGDLPPRAIETLREASLICCEDTRRTGRLLQHAGIVAGGRMAVTNDHTERSRIVDVLAELADDRIVAVVTDAGTPGISDPGERIVRAVLDAGYEVSAVPGPSAAITALVISGLPTRRFVFEGFIARSGRERERQLAQIADEERTVVVYEAPHRIERTMTDLVAACGHDRRVAVTRELTKLHEETLRGTLADVTGRLGTPRGEYVIVIDGKPIGDEPPSDDVLREALRDELGRGVGTKAASASVAERYGVTKRATYALAVAIANTERR